MIEQERKIAEKLPYARRYLKAARWGLDALLSQKPIGPGYLFHAIGLLSTLRACQHVLFNRDRKLSPRHEEVIGAWMLSTKNLKQFPELDFITKARNTILKDASFPSYATRSEGSWEGAATYYETAHYLDGAAISKSTCEPLWTGSNVNLPRSKPSFRPVTIMMNLTKSKPLPVWASHLSRRRGLRPRLARPPSKMEQ